MAYNIQTANLSQVKLMTDWAKQEGWNPGLNDANLFHLVDPNGFFIGMLDGEPISIISKVKYSPKFCFLGFYIVKPEYRNHGFGYQIWQHACAYSSDINTGLDGVVDQQTNYKKSGFKLAHRSIRYSLNNNSIPSYQLHPNLAQITSINISQILNYDKAFFPAVRDGFLASWLNDNNAKTFFYQENNQILGYGTIRQCGNGYKLGPLFADKLQIAEIIFNALCSTCQKNQAIFLDIPEPNTMAKKLVDELGMTPVFETARMYNKIIPEISIDRTYGITSFEIG